MLGTEVMPQVPVGSVRAELLNSPVALIMLLSCDFRDATALPHPLLAGLCLQGPGP